MNKPNLSNGITDEQRELRTKKLIELVKSGLIEPNYQDYMRSYYWIELSSQFREKYGNKCVECGIKQEDIKSKLNVHHKHYYTLGEEKEEDLMLLCDDCHKKVHKQMAEKLKQESKK